MEYVNIKEFKQLIQRYETITLNEIKKAFEIVHTNKFNENEAAKFLTGFSTRNCIVCLLKAKESKRSCKGCVFDPVKLFYKPGCYETPFLHDSYVRIVSANTPVKLKNAYRNRAKVLREFAKIKGIDLT